MLFFPISIRTFVFLEKLGYHHITNAGVAIVAGPPAFQLLFIIEVGLAFLEVCILYNIYDSVALITLLDDKWLLFLIENEPDQAYEKCITESSYDDPS